MVLVGRHWTGEYALATARHLLNRGCKVMAWTEEAKDDRFLSKVRVIFHTLKVRHTAFFFY